MVVMPERLGKNPLHRWRNRIVAEKLDEQWNVNYAVNKKYIGLSQYVPYTSLRCDSDDATAVVAGAGPSLSKNLEDLKYLRGQVDIFCTDKAMPMVSHVKLPRYVCALNAKSPNAEICDWWAKSASTKDSTLVMPLTSDPIALKNWVGKYCLINTGLPVDLTDRITQETGIRPIPSGSNVGVFTYLFAGRLGYKKLVLIGMDYSFKSREEILRRYRTEEEYIIFEFRNKRGEVRWSSWDWFDSAVMFFDWARFWEGHGAITINCTDGGIIYDGEYVKDMTLKEAGDALV